ncbi:MAG: hypothetical protein KME52_12025 [Desmonostoc geniculatum HA4340-LM1]|nr:hypothetical protein [Desmonostoc geniculatum HA4340-LM1]
MDRNHGDKQNPQGSKDEASQIQFGQERCDFLPHKGSNQSLGTESTISGNQPQRTFGNVFQGGNSGRGGAILGGTLSQLVKDCREQIAGNDRVIDSLQAVNRSLEEKAAYYQQLLNQIE